LIHQRDILHLFFHSFSRPTCVSFLAGGPSDGLPPEAPRQNSSTPLFLAVWMAPGADDFGKEHLLPVLRFLIPQGFFVLPPSVLPVATPRLDPPVVSPTLVRPLFLAFSLFFPPRPWSAFFCSFFVWAWTWTLSGFFFYFPQPLIVFCEFCFPSFPSYSHLFIPTRLEFDPFWIFV